MCIRDRWPMSQDAFKIHSKHLKTLLNKSSMCLETLWMNIECVLRRFRMIFQSVSRRFGIYSKRLKTLLNKYQSVLRHFGKSFESVSRRIQYSFKVSQDTLKIYSKASWDISNDFWMRLKTQVTFRIKVPSLSYPLDNLQEPPGGVPGWVMDWNILPYPS